MKEKVEMGHKNNETVYKSILSTKQNGTQSQLSPFQVFWINTKKITIKVNFEQINFFFSLYQTTATCTMKFGWYIFRFRVKRRWNQHCFFQMGALHRGIRLRAHCYATRMLQATRRQRTSWKKTWVNFVSTIIILSCVSFTAFKYHKFCNNHIVVFLRSRIHTPQNENRA